VKSSTLIVAAAALVLAQGAHQAGARPGGPYPSWIFWMHRPSPPPCKPNQRPVTARQARLRGPVR
jgi:hypothetical protein